MSPGGAAEWVRLLAGDDHASALHWPFKGLADREGLEDARELPSATRETFVLFLNDRPDLARIVRAPCPRTR